MIQAQFSATAQSHPFSRVTILIYWVDLVKKSKPRRYPNLGVLGTGLNAYA